MGLHHVAGGNIPFMRMIMVTTVMPHSLGLSSIEWETNFMRAKLLVVNKGLQALIGLAAAAAV
ncbi:hypothetical protein NC652_006940 [Populus alba x Populus x berolinensis]|uniref:Uncharacterized protein n=1 Tax=Populus alba x Populus x berolinensis TaxID=444605 RepID=A0AAD6WD52_9ROSI|nr:hypothetical protein NC652_006940 [Populus alba x Populus x berolinensis]KAJ7007972.1 hypothetical protein NC653_006875 [Populus alba x Populus x berolinensis]